MPHQTKYLYLVYYNSRFLQNINGTILEMTIGRPQTIMNVGCCDGGLPLIAQGGTALRFG